MTEWVPVLLSSRELSARASEAVDGIADAIIRKDFVMSELAAKRQRSYEEALLYGYLAVIRDDVDWANRAVECLNSAVDRAPDGMGLGLFGGLSGLGWTVEHISHLLPKVSGSKDEARECTGESWADENEQDLNAEVDTAILHDLSRIDPSRPYDLIGGLVGFGVYLIERWPRERALQGINEVFAQLECLAEVTDKGVTWHSLPTLLPDWQRKECPDGYYNLGVAHGIPGIIYFLSQISATSIVDPERSHRLLDGAVTWLIAQQRPLGARSRFSSWIVPGKESSDSRLTWCYGDLGIVAVLLQVARRAGRADWQEFARELLDHCLAWPPDEAGIGDSPFCHGAVGLAHIFNRIYQSEGDHRCLDASMTWYRRTLAMRRPGTGVGGFSALYRPDPEAPSVWDANPAFLDGAIGIALALLAALTPVEPCWDRSLLLSAKTLL